ncbi:MAG: WbqC family protein, partial [Phycisphaera sp.]|nr:WbqC family protein [Phycisphaera sp.]
QERLFDILGPLGATTYVSGPAARSYIDESEFTRRGISLHWMDYERYPEYPQPHGPFDHHVSIIDLLACVGPESLGHIGSG